MEQAHVLLDDDSDDDELEDLDQVYEEGRRFTYFYLICKRGTKQCRKGANSISMNAYVFFYRISHSHLFNINSKISKLQLCISIVAIYISLFTYYFTHSLTHSHILT